jgi:organic hydroperoxide reductase OsmC/OhrA
VSEHEARLNWTRSDGEEFLRGRYSRVHDLRFDSGTTLKASSSPSVGVPPQWSSVEAVDPEELFVASLSSCHMLWFLDFARRAKVEVRGYSDHAVGEMAKTEDGRVAVTRVTLRPKVECDADRETLDHLHHQAHEACFIANSVKTDVVVEPQF